MDTSDVEARWDSFGRVDKREVERTQAETARIKAETFEMLLLQSVPRFDAARLAGYTLEEADNLAQIERAFLGGEVTQTGASGQWFS